MFNLKKVAIVILLASVAAFAQQVGPAPGGGSGSGFTAGGDLSGTSTSQTVIGINGTNVAGLASGLYYNTTSTGVLSIATAAQVGTACSGVCATLASPTFTGVPAAPTASMGTNTTQLATTAFVLANAGVGTVTVVGAGSLTSTDCVTGGGSQTIQTPSANCTVSPTGVQTMLQAGIATTLTDSMILQNTTAATSGVPYQYSPSIDLLGAGWNATSSGSSVAVKWQIQVEPYLPGAAANPGNGLVLLPTTGGTAATPVTFCDLVVGGGGALIDLDGTGCQHTGRGAVVGFGPVNASNAFGQWNATQEYILYGAGYNIWMGTEVLGFGASNITNSNTADITWCRGGPGIFEIGASTSCGSGGSARAASFQSGGTKFTISGCSAGTTVGGATAGSFVSGTTGTCTVVITMNGATGLTAPNGWSCYANDTTSAFVAATGVGLIQQTGISTTTATLSGLTNSSDVIAFGCEGY